MARGPELTRRAPQRVTSNDLKAALNGRRALDRANCPPTIRDTINDGLADSTHRPCRSGGSGADRRRCAQIISAAWEIDAEGDWGGDLGRMVLVLAATGARFSAKSSA